MIVQIDFYKETGKWYSGGRVEIAALPWQEGVLEQIMQNQQELLKPVTEFYMVVNDIPESEKDPNYRMTYARLYSPDKLKAAHCKIMNAGGYKENDPTAFKKEFRRENNIN